MTLYAQIFQSFMHDEDRAVWKIYDKYLIAAVMDGHGGSRAATEIAKHISNLDATLLCDISNKAAFLHNLCNTLANTVKDDTSGAAVAIWVCDMLTGAFAFANVGDVLALHITPTTYNVLSTTHRIQANPEERKRLHDKGVLIDQAVSEAGIRKGVYRIMPGGLAMSRSWGDADVKGIVTTPFIIEGICNCDTDIIALLTDGVYDHILTTDIVHKIREKRTHRLIEKAKSRGSFDDCTILIVQDRMIQQSTTWGKLFRRSTSPESSTNSLEDLEEGAEIIQGALREK